MFKAITIDFWDTLFSGRKNSTAREKARFEAVLKVVDKYSTNFDIYLVESNYKSLWSYFDTQWLQHQRTPTSRELCYLLFDKLRGVIPDLEVPEFEIENLIMKFRRGVLEHELELLPNVKEALEILSQKYKLAIISDTAFSSGVELRQAMQDFDILKYFSNLVFSDEHNSAKPNPKMFDLALKPFACKPHEALHIGDIERTDIKGARDFGMQSILYTGGEKHQYAEETTNADYVLENWSKIKSINILDL